MRLKQLLLLSMLFFLQSNSATTTNSKNKHHLMLAPALMLTTFDSISLIYPKELGYAKDFLHTIYKIDTDNNSSKMKSNILRIEDAVYDNRTWSIYFIVSNSSGGSEIVQITHLVPFYRKKLNRKNDSHKLTNHSNRYAAVLTKIKKTIKSKCVEFYKTFCNVFIGIIVHYKIVFLMLIKYPFLVQTKWSSCS